jgi:hypothetical protein
MLRQHAGDDHPIDDQMPEIIQIGYCWLRTVALEIDNKRFKLTAPKPTRIALNLQRSRPSSCGGMMLDFKTRSARLAAVDCLGRLGR